jgi:hypothetical protein
MKHFFQVVSATGRCGLQLGLTMLLAGSLLSACGSSKEVTFKSGGMTHTFAEGKSAVPQGFPLPVYPGAQATGSVSAQGEKNADQSQFLLLSSSDSAEKIRDFYQKELPVAGWKVAAIQSMPKVISISATRDNLDASVMVSSEGDKTIINIGVSKNDDSEPEPAAADENYSPDKLTPPTD